MQYKLRTGESNFNVKSLAGTISCASMPSVVMDVLHELGLSVNYGSHFSHAVLSTPSEHNIFIPPKLCKGQFNFFSVDNSYFSGDCPEGKNTLYATAMGVFLQKPTKDHESCLFKKKSSTPS